MVGLVKPALVSDLIKQNGLYVKSASEKGGDRK
jgi:hypothetical protein